MTANRLFGFLHIKHIEKAGYSRYESFSGIILALGTGLALCLAPALSFANDYSSTPRNWGGESFIGTDPQTGDSVMSITPPAPPQQQQPAIPYIVPQVNMGDWQNQTPKPPIVLPPGYVPPSGIYPPGTFPPSGSYPPGGMYPPSGIYPPGTFPPSGSYPPGGMYPPDYPNYPVPYPQGKN